jgi:hypothetical protein
VVARGALVALLSLATLLPIAIVLVVGTSALFAALNDPTVARALNGVALALGIAWVFSLIGLTVALALDALVSQDTNRFERVGEDQPGPEE